MTNFRTDALQNDMLRFGKMYIDVFHFVAQNTSQSIFQCRRRICELWQLVVLLRIGMLMFHMKPPPGVDTVFNNFTQFQIWNSLSRFGQINLIFICSRFHDAFRIVRTGDGEIEV